MKISVATANYYYLPFEQTLEVIALAGFKYIELDLYWEMEQWAMAQHLKNVSPKEAVQIIDSFDLRVSSIHNGGGVMEDTNTCKGFINPQLAEYLDQLGYAPGCIVFHTPHISGEYDDNWWQSISEKIVTSAEAYRSQETSITIENMPYFDGYYVPMTQPEELKEFTLGKGIEITMDTTHYAQIGVNISEAAKILGEKVKTIHISDFIDKTSHVFIGDGELDFTSFFQAINLSILHTITLECSAGYFGENVIELDREMMVKRLETAKSRLHNLVKTA